MKTARVYWDGSDSEESHVFFPEPGIDEDSGNITYYGRVAVICGAAGRDFPLREAAIAKATEPNWQIVS